jgi:methionine-S-sulfoxide reductase
MEGVVRTRVGYTGGEKDNPTYYSLGNHTEAVQIDYDPSVISYEDLLDVFWESHDPSGGPWSRQYMAAVFSHGEKQQKAAETAKKRVAAEMPEGVDTQILPLARFHLAEDYHQKYMLRRNSKFANIYHDIYPTTEDLIGSTAAARVNGHLAGYGECGQLKSEIGSFGLPAKLQDRLLGRICGS